MTDLSLFQTGALLKPFLPQLQTTFLKAIHDPHQGVRLRSGSALSFLVAIHLKPEPIFQELQSALKDEEDVAIRETLIFCMRKVFTQAGPRVPEPIRKQVMASLTSYVTSDHEGTRQVAAGAIAAVLASMTDVEAKSAASVFVGNSSESDPVVKHGQMCTLFSALKQSPEKLLAVCSEKQILSTVIGGFSNEDPLVLQAVATSVGYFMLYKVERKEPIGSELLVPFCKLVNNPSNEVKQSMCRATQFVCESLSKSSGEGTQLPLPTIKQMIPALVNATKEKNHVVKSSAEMALVALLLMKEGEKGMQKVVSSLEGAVKTNLTDCISRSLRKSVYYPVTEGEIDTTVLS